MRFAKGIALLLCLVPVLSAADRDAWLKISSPHFDLFTTASERAGRDLVKHFEQVHSFFLQRFGTGIEGDRKARVILFRSEKEYEPYRPNEFASAFYQPGEYHDVIVMTNAIENSRPVAVHELTHLMIHQIGLDLPPWLNEGLGEIYSSLEPRGSQVMVGRDLPIRMGSLATEPWIGLRTLLSVDHASPIYNEKSRAGIFYAESWKLVHMLMLHPEYAPHFSKLITALRKDDPETAFCTTYGKPLDAIERDARAYLSGGRISAALFDIQLPKSIDAPVIETGASMFGRLAIAEMLSNVRGHSEQAREEYEAIARNFPGRWEVEEARGRFAWHERKLDEASQHFKKAEDLGCQDGSMFLLWGRVLGYARSTREAVVVLGEAAKLLNESDEVQLEYGNALTINGNWGSAVAVLRTVKKAPAAAMWRYHYNLAYSLYRTGDTEAAKALIPKARQYAASAREASSLDQLETAIDRPARMRSDTAPSVLVRQDASLPRVTGKLEEMECGKLARLHVRVEGAVWIFVIPDPAAIPIASATGEPVELQCGRQKNAPTLRVEYQVVPGSPDVAGLVRTLEVK
jgi:tetratricopeptide (TPR) repeat protein